MYCVAVKDPIILPLDAVGKCIQLGFIVPERLMSNKNM